MRIIAFLLLAAPFAFFVACVVLIFRWMAPPAGRRDSIKNLRKRLPKEVLMTIGVLLLWAFTRILDGGLTSARVTGPQSQSQPQSQSDADAAHMIASQFIAEEKAPLSVDFPDDYKAARLSNGSWYVSSYVNIHNGSVGKLRKTWSCDLKYNGGNDDQLNSRHWSITGFCGVNE